MIDFGKIKENLKIEFDSSNYIERSFDELVSDINQEIKNTDWRIQNFDCGISHFDYEIAIKIELFFQGRDSAEDPFTAKKMFYDFTDFDDFDKTMSSVRERIITFCNNNNLNK